MVGAVIKLYFIGTALTVLAVLYEMADSLGGLMYVQDHRYLQELDQQTQRELSSSSHRIGRSTTKSIGS